MKNLLKLEELAELLLAALVFARLPYAWWYLPALLLLPDLSIPGYLAGPRLGAFTYNVAHHKAPALATGGLVPGPTTATAGRHGAVVSRRLRPPPGLRPQVRHGLPALPPRDAGAGWRYS